MNITGDEAIKRYEQLAEKAMKMRFLQEKQAKWPNKDDRERMRKSQKVVDGLLAEYTDLKDSKQLRMI